MVHPARPGRARMVAAVSIALLALGLVTLRESLAWRGATFPGFFLMPNRVVPSAGLPSWAGVGEGRPIYQAALLAVDGAEVRSADAGYRAVARRAPGETVQCLFARDGGLDTRLFTVRRFSDREYVVIFGMYFVTGLAYVLLGFLAGWRWQDGEAYRGLALFGWTAAVFAFTGMDLYTPGRFFRLHALSEVLIPAAALHMVIGCGNRQTDCRPVLRVVYALAFALGAIYELVLYEPAAYTALHDTAQALSGVPLIVFAVSLVRGMAILPAEYRPGSATRFLVGAFGGIVLPGCLMCLSGLTGGKVAVNPSAWVGFLFPAACFAALPPLVPAKLPQ